MPDQQFQYVKLPDGRYGKFAANATDAQIHAAVAKDFPNAYKSTQPPAAAPAAAAPAAAAPAEEFKLMTEKAPENARFPALGPTGYELLDALGKSLPAVGATTGSLVTSPGLVASPVAAGLGAMAGDRAQRAFNKFIYRDLPPETLKEAGTSMGVQGLIGLGTETGTQAINRYLLDPLITKFSLARETFRDARAGEGIRRLPGEAANDPEFKRAESILGHLPGSAGTMGKFRTGQTEDIYQRFERQLDAISKENLTPQEAGKRIQTALRDVKGSLDPAINADVEKIDTAEQQHAQALFDRRLSELSPDHVTSEEVGQGVQENVRAGKQAVDDTIQRDLQRIRETQQQSVDQLFRGQLDALHPSPIPKEKIGEAIQTDLRTAKAQTDQALQTHTATIRQQQQQSVNKILDDQATKLSPRPRPSEDTGKSIQAKFTGMQNDADAAIEQKYNDVRDLLGKGPNEFLSPADFDKAVEAKPEARSKLEEARMLFQQRDARFAPPILQKIIKMSNPEDISGILENASLDELRLIKSNLPPALEQAAARDVYDGMIRQATDPRTGIVSVKSLSNQLKQLGPERGQILFGNQYDAIADVTNKQVDAINSAADANVENATRQANARYSPELLQKILKTNKPEEIASVFQNAGADELRAFKATLPAQQQQEASRAVLDNIIDGARDPQTGVISGAKMAKSLRDLGDQRGRILFGDQYDKIIQSSQTFNQINESAEQSAAQVQNRSAQYAQSLYAKILKTNKPETITDMVKNAGWDELRTLKAQLPPELQQRMGRDVFQSILDKARDPQTGAINAKILARSLRDLGPERGQIILGDQYQNVIDSSQALTRINEAAEAQRKSAFEKGGTYTTNLMKKVIQTDRPEAIAAMMRDAGTDELGKFRNELSPETQQVAARNVLEDIIRPSREIGVETGGALDPLQLAKALDRGLKDLGPARGAIIFGKQYDNILKAAEEMRSLGLKESPMAGALRMSGLLRTMSTTFFGATLLGHPGAGVALAASEFLGPKMLSLMLTNPEFSTFTLKSLRLLNFAAARGVQLGADELFQDSPARYAPIPQLEAPTQ